PLLHPPSPLQSFLPLQSCLPLVSSASRVPGFAVVFVSSDKPFTGDVIVWAERAGAAVVVVAARAAEPASNPVIAAAIISFEFEVMNQLLRVRSAETGTSHKSNAHRRS